MKCYLHETLNDGTEGKLVSTRWGERGFGLETRVEEQDVKFPMDSQAK